MLRTLGVMALLGCAAQPRAGRSAAGPYKDVPVAVGAAVVGAEQFPDPPAGTPPTSTAPNDPPNLCRNCLCFVKGLGPMPLTVPRKTPDGSGYRHYDTRATCQTDCKAKGYTGFTCSGEKTVTWFE